MPEPSALQRFQMLVLGDAELQRELRQCPDRTSFVARVLECARTRGVIVARNDVEAALDSAAQAWITRWVRR